MIDLFACCAPLRRRARSLSRRMAPRSAAWMLLALLGVLIVSGKARAEYRYRVVVLEQPSLDALASEVLSRLKGELKAADFEVVVIPLGEGDDPRSKVETEGKSLQPAATFALGSTRDGNVQTLRLWLSDRIADKLFVQQWQGDPRFSSRVARVLAVQGVELVRARLADWWLKRPPRAAKKERAPPSRPAPPPPSPSETPIQTPFSVFLGLGLLHNGASESSTYTPVLRLSYSERLSLGQGHALALSARLGVAALGGDADHSTSAGTASVSQSFVMADAVVDFMPDSSIKPFSSLSAGVYRVEYEGSGQGRFFGRSGDTLSPAAGAGIGLIARPIRHLQWIAEAQALFAFEPTELQINGVEVATFGDPLLALTGGVAAVF